MANHSQKKLERKLRSLERKYERESQRAPKAVWLVSRLQRLYEKYTRRLAASRR